MNLPVDGSANLWLDRFMVERHPGLCSAIRKVGNISRLADLLGISNQAVCKWHRVPVGRVLDVERLTGISRYDLRPDIYGDAPLPPVRARGNEPRAAA